MQSPQTCFDTLTKSTNLLFSIYIPEHTYDILKEIQQVILHKCNNSVTKMSYDLNEPFLNVNTGVY